MTDDRKPESLQARWQHAACCSNVQPAMRWKQGIPPDRIAETFTTDAALALVGLRKEGDGYVRN